MRYILRMTALAVALCLSKIASADEIDRLLERYSAQMMAERFSVTVDTKLSAAVEEVFDQVVEAAESVKDLPKLDRKPKVTVIVSNEANAYSIAGGNIYITTGLCGLTGINRHEVAAALAHELGHSLRNHSQKSLRTKLIGTAALSLLDKNSQQIGNLVWQLFTSGHSRKEEEQADRDAWAIMQKSSFRSSAPLALLRRFETMAESKPDILSQLFATHPPLVSRTKGFKDWLIQSIYSWDFSLVGRAQAAGDQVLSEFANTDENWKVAYRASTGWDTYHFPNYFSKGYQGECTWFVFGVRLDELPLNPPGGNNAITLPERCIRAGYATGKIPKIGAIIVWDETVGNGAGHLALIVDILPDGKLLIWDSNWGPEAKDSNYTNGRVRQRIISPTSKIKGYIYWPNNQSEAPPGYPGYKGPAARSSIMLIEQQFTLGDEGDDAEMIRTKQFELTPNELSKLEKPKLRMKIRSLPKKDPIISLNRQEIGRIVASSDDWQTFVIPIPPKLLRTNNLLDIETFIPSASEGYDDCQIKEVELVLG